MAPKARAGPGQSPQVRNSIWDFQGDGRGPGTSPAPVTFPGVLLEKWIRDQLGLKLALQYRMGWCHHGKQSNPLCHEVGPKILNQKATPDKLARP